MSLTGFALAQAGQALIRAMSKTTLEGKGCACIAYLCTILRMFPTLLSSYKLCSWLAFAALGRLPTPPLFGGTFSAAAAVSVASFPCGRSKFGFRFRNATFETRFLHFTRQAHTEKATLSLAMHFWKIGLSLRFHWPGVNAVLCFRSAQVEHIRSSQYFASNACQLHGAPAIAVDDPPTPAPHTIHDRDMALCLSTLQVE